MKKYFVCAQEFRFELKSFHPDDFLALITQDRFWTQLAVFSDAEDVTPLVLYPEHFMGAVLALGFELMEVTGSEEVKVPHDFRSVTYFSTDGFAESIGTFYCTPILDEDEAFEIFLDLCCLPSRKQSLVRQILNGANVVAIGERATCLIHYEGNGVYSGKPFSLNYFYLTPDQLPEVLSDSVGF